MNDSKAAENQASSWRVEEWFPDLSSDVLKNLKLYNDELNKFNKTVNLVSPKTLPFADVIHFADSILASRIINKYNPNIDKIFDLGSGNGFPGLVFGLLYPNTQVILVDSDQRKSEFLKHVISTTKAKNITVANQTIETLPENSISFAMARGYASISRAILATRKNFQKGGKFFHLKSEEWGKEVAEIPTQLCSVWTPALVGEYKLPAGPVKFAVVATEKIG